MTVLAATHLSKSYGKRPVVKDVSFSVSQGEVVGILGPNGAGKTTCFYMTIGLVRQDGGQILIDNLDISELPMHGRARKGLGYLPQEPSIFRKLSVSDNILAILEMRKDLNTQQRLEKLDSLLNEFHITHLTESYGMSLSGGERRRVEIARALATDPKFILLDEPFAGVDPISVNDIKSIIRHLSDKGIGVLITDHNVRETLDICTRAYIIGEGHVIAEGTTAHILSDQKVRDTYLGDNFTM
ncbi:MAG: Lipopolysaccharide export system ATP-binding protein LptB [Cellvibrionales bacterium UBA7375]|nr:LPS export ABC transporter ATP-binding protein [Porticoccaceae bacterium]RPG84501.1 MAG: LPS export ABC transporter ATP-binding protein [Cellvibrionales bacterium TMED47]CAI8377115.1 MAG: Lipopolysaccharide export system ATP-binding protein LptB [Cellvibrionales bacterium UBA7375]|tara:strand:+ start:945 stop:1670 length:726 start_codon:yes stop_codon:yes gene_type:complete